MRRLIAALAMAAAAAAQLPPGRPISTRARRIRLVVGSDAGGGYDSYARTFAQHLRRHIPGEPTIIVQNMPGAGGMVAANWTVQRRAQGRH